MPSEVYWKKLTSAAFSFANVADAMEQKWCYYLTDQLTTGKKNRKDFTQARLSLQA